MKFNKNILTLSMVLLSLTSLMQARYVYVDDEAPETTYKSRKNDSRNRNSQQRSRRNSGHRYAQKHDENVVAATAEMPGNVVASLFGGGYANRERVD